MLKHLLRVTFLATICFAQSERGNIAGTVTDPAGAILPNAPVTVTNRATNIAIQASTNGSGEFNAPNLSPGEYRVEVIAPGFRRYAADIILNAAGSVRLSVALTLGDVSESVEVEARAVVVQTEDAKLTSTVDNKLVDQLPLVVSGAVRSSYDLMSTVAEAKVIGNAGAGATIVVGGGQAQSYGATLDGITILTNNSQGNQSQMASFVQPSLEAITEFSVDTSGYKAEYGQGGGGNITFASKSGTNSPHGSAYEFLRNDAFDARGFFAPQRNVYKQHNFGVTFGGPVVLPKIYDGHNKTFFFVAYEGFRNRITSPAAVFSVPTPEMYKGDFSNLVDSAGRRLLIYDPRSTTPAGSGFTRTAFPSNQIPVTQFAALSKAMIPFASPVVPNVPGLVPGTFAYINNNYRNVTGNSIAPNDKGSIKLDHNINANHHMGYLFNKTVGFAGPGPAGPDGLPYPIYASQVNDYASFSHRLTYDWIVSPRLVNHFAVGGNDVYATRRSLAFQQGWKAKGVCMVNAVNCDLNFPRASFTEFAGWGANATNGLEQPTYSIKDDVSFLSGSHTMKFGYAWDSQHAIGYGAQAIAGAAGYTFRETAVPGATTLTSGSSFASFLLGAANSGNTETERSLEQIYTYNGFYAQDDWRISKKLLLNYGIRYEFTLPPVTPGDQYSDFSPTTPNPNANGYLGALVFGGFGTGRQNTRRMTPGWYKGVSPRLSFAYSADTKTSIRAGFARSFGRQTSVGSTTHYDGFIGQYSFSSPNQGITPAFYADQGLPAYLLPPQINPSFSNNLPVDYWNGQSSNRPAESLDWNLSIQRQLSNSTVVDASYHATVGTHLQSAMLNINQVPMSIVNGLIQRLGPQAAISLLNSDINSAAARAQNIPIPYANFTNPAFQLQRTVNQALRPYPQYSTIDVGNSAGDKTGRSSYHAFILKLNRRMGAGLTLQTSYVFSKILTDSDSFGGGAASIDHGNRSLEKSIGRFDQTHVLKINGVYELPFGPGKRMLSSGVASRLLGDWRISAILNYASGFPMAVTTNAPLPIFNTANRPVINSYDNWATTSWSDYDPQSRFYNTSAFPTQPLGVLGNATRLNPRLRAQTNANENISLQKTFALSEKFRIDFRAEAFNLFNRTVYNTPASNLSTNTFGQVTAQSNNPRQMQFALKLYW